MLPLIADTTAATGTPDFGVFGQLADYGPLGLAVLALGYVAWIFLKRHLAETQYGVLGFAVLGLGYLCWVFLNRLMKSEEDLRTRVEELEGEYREDLEKKLEESTESSKSLKETVLTLFGSKKK